MLVRSDRGLFFMIEYYIFYNKMIIVNCAVKKNIPMDLKKCCNINDIWESEANPFLDLRSLGCLVFDFFMCNF